jgi:hypothetical protein
MTNIELIRINSRSYNVRVRFTVLKKVDLLVDRLCDYMIWYGDN